MANDKTCKYCGETGLNWDYEHHANTGKWRLIKHKGCTSGSLRYGNDRCRACRWNGKKVCDLRSDDHVAKI